MLLHHSGIKKPKAVASLKFMTPVGPCHAIERSAKLRSKTPPHSNQVDTNDLLQFTITNSASRRFFRARYVP